MDTRTDDRIVCNNYENQKITTLPMCYWCTTLTGNFFFCRIICGHESVQPWQYARKTKPQKITKYDIVRQTALWNYHYKWYVFFHFSAPQHSWCTQCTQTSRVAGVCHLCVTDKLTVARHHAAVSDRHFLLSLPFFLQEGKRGAGEMWVFSPTTDSGVFTIQCCGGEQGLYLEHGQG